MKGYNCLPIVLMCTMFPGLLLAQSQPKIIDGHMHYISRDFSIQ
jgi:hypothetical protein